MGSVNPEAAFNNMVAQNKDAQTAMEITKQYGNGDPKTAFMNYAREKGKTVAAQRIMERLGLK